MQVMVAMWKEWTHGKEKSCSVLWVKLLDFKPICLLSPYYTEDDIEDFQPILNHLPCLSILLYSSELENFPCTYILHRPLWCVSALIQILFEILFLLNSNSCLCLHTLNTAWLPCYGVSWGWQTLDKELKKIHIYN